MKPEFIEDYQNPHTDPLAPTCDEFDYDAVSRALGEPDERPEAEVSRRVRDLAPAFRAMLTWLLDTPLSKTMPEKVGRRLIALAWNTDPSFFGSNPSMAFVARGLGLTPQLMHELSAEATARFGIVNRAQAHGWNRKAPRNTPHGPMAEREPTSLRDGLLWVLPDGPRQGQSARARAVALLYALDPFAIRDIKEAARLAGVENGARMEALVKSATDFLAGRNQAPEEPRKPASVERGTSDNAPNGGS